MSWLSEFDEKLDFQPPVTPEQLAKLPAKRGVALLLAEGDHPIVLLPCADIRSRVSARMRNPQEDARQKMPDLRGITLKIAWMLAGGHFETDLQFLELAARIWPKTYQSLLAFKKARFVHVNPAEVYPRFARADDVFERAGRYFGPFPNGRSAERFVEAVQEAFDLCRDIRCLRQAPHGPRCSYGQMGRCLCPCDGTIPMEKYREVVAAAADYVAGERRGLLNDLTRQMRESAGKLEFEKAARVKSHIERLRALEAEEFRHVRPAEDFRYLLVQPTGSRGKASVFFASGGTIVHMPPLSYPPKREETEALLVQMASSAKAWASQPTLQPASSPDAWASQPTLQPEPASDVPIDNSLGQWRMAMVSHYLYCSPEKSGLILHARPELTAEFLESQLDEWAEALHLIKPPRGEKPSETPATPPSAEEQPPQTS